MKINNFGTSTTPFLADRDANSKVGKSGDFFAADLLKSQDTQSMDRLTALLAEIDVSGKQLSTVPTYAELRNYRELVRNFIGEAVGRMYSLESQSGWDRHGRHKMFKIIRKVDETLVGMAEDVRVGQERQLSIMAKHDAIRGMLVDLYS
ncbi:MAG TPA: YaaR family protein [Patescibacteria group bacterium]|nr:YaaR family protein [Patescibacteria group bacterium]